MNILFVDDESFLLRGMHRILRDLRNRHNFFFAESGQEALNIFDEHSIDLIVSDMRMPEMNGLELLKIVKERSPSTIRFILSGYSDQKMINESVEITHQFFVKPCDPNLIRSAILRIEGLGKTLSDPGVRRLISGINRLPSIPEIYAKICEELQKESCDIDEVAKLITKDVSLSAEVLHLVNSAFFGLAQRLTDIRQAVMFLGVEIIRSVVFVVGIKDEFPNSVSPYFNFQDFCHHSTKVASIAKALAHQYKFTREEIDQVFSLGVLHDIGRIVQAAYLHQAYKTYHELKEDTISLGSENEIFGANHAQIGAYLMVVWGLPLSSAQVVAFHHTPANAVLEDLRYLHCIFLAELLCENPDVIFDEKLQKVDSAYAYLKSVEIEPLLIHVRANRDLYLK